MGKISIIPFGKGLRNDVTAFNIDNDSFPKLVNAYQWRGRVKRKRGTALLTRLRRFFNSNSTSYNSGSATITLNGSGIGNILSGFSLQADAALFPGSVTIVDTTTATTYTDPAMNGTLSPSGTINYASGVIDLGIARAGDIVRVSFNYYPNLPVMGEEDLILEINQFPGTLGFDTKYSYNVNTSSPYTAYDVSFYKNPASGSYPSFVRKTVWTPTSWNGQDYQQFWTVNYQGALWATNGINIPFSATNVGMQYKPIVAVTVTSGGPPAIVNLQITAHGLVVGDFLFINEVQTTTGINFQTGYVTAVVNANNVTVEFPNATIATNGTGGIAQYLTNRSDITKDCLRWYDGDPTDGNVTTPTLSSTKGWVNFAPPISQDNFSIADLPAAQYYLVGARMIATFKDRLLFFGPVVQTSSAGSQVYLQDTIIYSQNGTPYYTASFTNITATVDNPTLAGIVFNPILVPTNQTATAPAYFSDSAGFGGFVTAGIDQKLNTESPSGDAIILGFDYSQVRLVYTGNDIVPFNMFIVNSELGSSSTFSIVNLDKGVMTRGSRGYVISSQVESSRFDLEIPDEVFEIRLTDNGTERFCSQRDFLNEWIYFTFPIDLRDDTNYKFPTQTLQYNYRDQSWGIFNETYTTYGLFRKSTGYTWATIGEVYPTWAQWNDPWDSGTSNLDQPEVIAGTQQGFIMIRGEGTAEGNSMFIKNISGNIVTSPNHCLSEGDYIIISGCLGTVANQVNGFIFSIHVIDANTFNLNPPITGGTYLGSGLIKRMYVPFIQTKQFPVAWENGRKTRLGVQKYLFTTTAISQITLLIFLSQNDSSAYNQSMLTNKSLIYSNILYTCPESTNLGLTPFNSNLQTPTASQQQQIWHRINTSLIGDTVQLGFTMSDAQMRALTQISPAVAITGASQANPCVLQCTGEFAVNELIRISGVLGMVELNNVSNGAYLVLASNATTVTIGVDSTSFTPYVSGGTATPVAPLNQFAEIELHAINIDVTPSQMLV